MVKTILIGIVLLLAICAGVVFLAILSSIVETIRSVLRRMTPLLLAIVAAGAVIGGLQLASPGWLDRSGASWMLASSGLLAFVATYLAVPASVRRSRIIAHNTPVIDPPEKLGQPALGYDVMSEFKPLPSRRTFRGKIVPNSMARLEHVLPYVVLDLPEEAPIAEASALKVRRFWDATDGLLDPETIALRGRIDGWVKECEALLSPSIRKRRIDQLNAKSRLLDALEEISSRCSKLAKAKATREGAAETLRTDFLKRS